MKNFKIYPDTSLALDFLHKNATSSLENHIFGLGIKNFNLFYVQTRNHKGGWYKLSNLNSIEPYLETIFYLAIIL